MTEFLNDKEAAEILSLSEKTLRAWRMKGRGPQYRKLESSVRYTRQDLQKWADSRVVVPRPNDIPGEKVE